MCLLFVFSLYTCSYFNVRLILKYLESEVSTWEGDGVEVNARLQVVGTQNRDALI